MMSNPSNSRRRSVFQAIAQDLLLHPIRLIRMLLAVVWSVILAVVAVTAVSLGSWVGDHTMPRIWLRVVLWILGIRVMAVGTDKFDRSGLAVYVSNHQSILDGMALVVCLRKMPRFVGKASIGRIPVFGLAWTKLGHILIDRRKPADAWETLDQSAGRIAGRYPVYFAPEGTRSSSDTIGPFKTGAFYFAKKLGVPVVPVALRNTGQLWPPGTLAIRPGTIEIEFGNPIYVNDINHDAEATRQWIASRLAS